jgi:LAS superfamily LD-carboxypeptidase LdcB
MGEFTPSKHHDFKRLKSPYTRRGDAWLRIETANAFKKMADAAKLDGINLYVISATRNKSYQRGIWERKWASRSGSDVERARDILKYSSMPGTSRHHWGTDLDINSLEPAWWTKGEGLKIWEWMQVHAASFGFFQPYTGNEYTRLSGYKEERWHWSYHPQSSKMLRAYNVLIDYKDLGGFSGSSSASEVQVIERYVNGIYSGQ